MPFAQIAGVMLPTAMAAAPPPGAEGTVATESAQTKETPASKAPGGQPAPRKAGGPRTLRSASVPAELASVRPAGAAPIANRRRRPDQGAGIMPGLIVIQIVPQAPVDALTFRTHLVGLQVQAFDLSFTTVDTNPPGVNVGTASYIADSGGWTNVGGQAEMINPPSYPANITSGIIQQVDFDPSIPPTWTYRLQSVAIAIIPITAPGNSGNFRVEIRQGGQTVTTIPYQYNRTFDPVAIPDLATWPIFADGVFVSSWAAQPVDFYVSVPAAPTTMLLQLPADGTPPPFGDLLNAVQQVVANDRVAATTVTTSAAAPAGSHDPEPDRGDRHQRRECPPPAARSRPVPRSSPWGPVIR